MRLGLPPAGRVLAVWAGAFGAWLYWGVLMMFGSTWRGRLESLAGVAVVVAGAVLLARWAFRRMLARPWTGRRFGEAWLLRLPGWRVAVLFGVLWLMTFVGPVILGAVTWHRFPPLPLLAYQLPGALISASGFGALFTLVTLRQQERYRRGLAWGSAGGPLG